MPRRWRSISTTATVEKLCGVDLQPYPAASRASLTIYARHVSPALLRAIRLLFLRFARSTDLSALSLHRHLLIFATGVELAQNIRVNQRSWRIHTDRVVMRRHAKAKSVEFPKKISASALDHYRRCYGIRWLPRCSCHFDAASLTGC